MGICTTIRSGRGVPASLWTGTLLAVLLASAGCAAPSHLDPDVHVVTGEDVLSGRVIGAVWEDELAFFNASGSPVGLDERLLQYRIDGQWSPCIEEGQWRDDGWGVLIEPGAAVGWFGSQPTTFWCLPADGIRYDNVVIMDAGENLLPRAVDSPAHQPRGPPGSLRPWTGGAWPSSGEARTGAAESSPPGGRSST